MPSTELRFSQYPPSRSARVENANRRRYRVHGSTTIASRFSVFPAIAVRSCDCRLYRCALRLCRARWTASGAKKKFPNLDTKILPRLPFMKPVLLTILPTNSVRRCTDRQERERFPTAVWTASCFFHTRWVGIARPPDLSQERVNQSALRLFRSEEGHWQNSVYGAI